MVCTAGRPKLSADDDRELHAYSAGICLLCSRSLFEKGNLRVTSIAERAHIVAHSFSGPRGSETLSAPQRASPNNIVLLCPTCHTLVDKSPDEYPAHLLLAAKRARREAVEAVGQVRTFEDRRQARRYVEAILARNHAVFLALGPDSVGALASPEAAAMWSHAVLRDIVPGNELIVAVVNTNQSLGSAEDRDAAEQLRLHTIDLAQKHRDGVIAGPALRFPSAAERIFKDEA